jgi:hypothetical protein
LRIVFVATFAIRSVINIFLSPLGCYFLFDR